MLIENSMYTGRDRFSNNYGQTDEIGYCQACDEPIFKYEEYEDNTYQIFCNEKCMNNYYELEFYEIRDDIVDLVDEEWYD